MDAASGGRGILGTRRRLAVAATAVALAAGALAAYAELGGPGPGGTVPLAGTSAVSVAPTTVGPLSPQINPADTTAIEVSVDNTASAAVSVGQITGTVRTSGGCQSAWFTVAPIAAPGPIAPGEHTYPSSVILNDNDRDQTACTSQRQTIDWAIAGS